MKVEDQIKRLELETVWEERKEIMHLLDCFASSLSACLNTYPDLRVEEVHRPLFADWTKLRNRKTP